jgi:hypothetical protein
MLRRKKSMTLAETILEQLQRDAAEQRQAAQQQAVAQIVETLRMVYTQLHEREDRHDLCSPLMVAAASVEQGHVFSTLIIVAGILGKLVVPLDDQDDLPIQLIVGDAVRELLEDK